MLKILNNESFTMQNFLKFFPFSNFAYGKKLKIRCLWCYYLILKLLVMLKPFKILVAGVNKDFSLIPKNYLAELGYTVILCHDGLEAINHYQNDCLDFLLLDVRLPNKGGIELVEEIRKKDTEIPIILMGSNTHKSEIIKGFKNGADDFIISPFSIEEIGLRIEAIKKRAKIMAANRHIYKLGNYIFDTVHHVLIYKGREKRLTTKELDLLFLFCEYMNRVVERSVALKRVWKEDNYFSARNMDVYIGRLRNMLCEDPNVKLENVHGVGYRLVVNYP